MMRERKIRLIIALYQAPLVYLFVANNLAIAGEAMLPFSFVTDFSGISFSVQITLLTMQLVGYLTIPLVLKRRKRRRAQIPSTTTSDQAKSNIST